MFGGISRFVSICKYPFYELKSHKQRIAPDDPVSHYWHGSKIPNEVYKAPLNLEVFQYSVA